MNNMTLNNIEDINDSFREMFNAGIEPFANERIDYINHPDATVDDIFYATSLSNGKTDFSRGSTKVHQAAYDRVMKIDPRHGSLFLTSLKRAQAMDEIDAKFAQEAHVMKFNNKGIAKIPAEVVERFTELANFGRNMVESTIVNYMSQRIGTESVKNVDTRYSDMHFNAKNSTVSAARLSSH